MVFTDGNYYKGHVSSRFQNDGTLFQILVKPHFVEKFTKRIDLAECHVTHCDIWVLDFLVFDIFHVTEKSLQE